MTSILPNTSTSTSLAAAAGGDKPPNNNEDNNKTTTHVLEKKKKKKRNSKKQKRYNKYKIKENRISKSQRKKLHQQQQKNKTKVCRQYQETGNCVFGEECKFLHILPAVVSVAPGAPANSFKADDDINMDDYDDTDSEEYFSC